MSIVKIVPIKKEYNSENFYEGSLAKQGYTRAPGTYESLCPWKDASGKYRTNLDENARYIAYLSSEDAELEKKRVRELREDLERKSGLDLSPTSDFYRSISTDNPLKLGDDPVILDREKYADEITYQWVKAHPWVAPSLEEFQAGGPTISPLMKFTLVIEDEEQKQAYNNKQEINKCIAKLEKASEDKMLSWAKMLGLRVSDASSKERLYNELDTFLREGRTSKGVKTTNLFNSVSNLSAELLQVKVLVKDGLDYSILRTGELGTIYFGQDKLANSIAELEEFLIIPKNQNVKLMIEKSIKEKIAQIKLKS